jgi:hypothetical protein
MGISRGELVSQRREAEAQGPQRMLTADDADERG